MASAAAGGRPDSAAALGPGRPAGEPHGVSRTASALGLDYYSLKKRAEAGGQPTTVRAARRSSSCLSPVVVGKQCLFELDNGAGATMRVQLVGYDAADVEALARSFWNAE